MTYMHSSQSSCIAYWLCVFALGFWWMAVVVGVYDGCVFVMYIRSCVILSLSKHIISTSQSASLPPAQASYSSHFIRSLCASPRTGAYSSWHSLQIPRCISIFLNNTSQYYCFINIRYVWVLMHISPTWCMNWVGDLVWINSDSRWSVLALYVRCEIFSVYNKENKRKIKESKKM